MAQQFAMSTLVTVSLALMLFSQGVVSYPHVTEIIMPQFPARRANVTLECRYDTGREKLYRLKWFHNNEEFYRYMPEEKESVDVFNNSNIQILDWENKKNSNKIILKEVDLSAAGEYKCQVNLGWPEHKEDTKKKNMTVVVIPQQQPNIEGDLTDRYSVGSSVNLNCTAAPSIPAAELQWLINDALAPEEYLHHYEIVKLDDGLMITNLGLNFKLSQKDFINGELKLKCTATISTLYNRSDEHSQSDPTAAVRERPSEESLVTTLSSTGHNMWTSVAHYRVLGLPLMTLALVCVNLLW